MKNINLEAAYIHIITDIILSIGVIIAALIIYFFADNSEEWSYWHLADPLCTYLFSILAVYSTWPILKESLIILLDGCDNPHLINQVERELKRMQEVREVT
jgi:zinc transporter 2